MAEIASLTAGRAFALETDAIRARDRQDQARARLETQRQAELDQQARDATAQQAADRLRVQRARDDIEAQNQLRDLIDAREVLRQDEIAARRGELARADSLDREARAQDRANVDREFEINRNQLAAETAPATGNAAPPERFDAAQAPRALGEAAAAGATPTAAQLREAQAQAQVAERDARVAERRAAERDAAIQQQIDLQLSNDRISATLFNPDLPRGSVVDVVG